MRDTVYCEECECMMESREEEFVCPKCNCSISWDAYYEEKAFRWGRW